MTYDDAVDFCAAVNGRLCTRDEMYSDCTAGTGCSLGRVYQWTSDTDLGKTLMAQHEESADQFNREVMRACCSEDAEAGVNWGPILSPSCSQSHGSEFEQERSCGDMNSVLFGTVSRKCQIQNGTGDFGWSKVNTSTCQNTRILALAKITFKNLSSAINVLDELAEALNNTALVNRLDVEPAVEILWKVARSPTGLSLNVLRSTVAVVSNIMKLPRALLAGSSIQEIPQIVDTITASVATITVDLNISVEYTAENMVVSILTVPSLTKSSWNNTHKNGTIEASASMISVEVPSLVRLIGYTDPTAPLQIVVYSGDLFFAHVGGNQSINHNETIISSIVSVNVGNSSQKNDLSYHERVSVTFDCDDASTNEVTCASWKPHGFNGAGWSSSGCVVDTLRSTPTQTVCSCDHLSAFAIVTDLPTITASRPGYRQSRSLSTTVYVGVGLSLLCLAATLVIHLIRPGTLHQEVKLIVQFCVVLACSEVLYVIMSSTALNLISCTTVATLLQFTAVCAFTYIAIEVNLTVNAFTANLPGSSTAAPGLTKSLVLLYAIPFLFAIAGVTINMMTDESVCNTEPLQRHPWGLVGPIAVALAVLLLVFLAIVAKAIKAGNIVHSELGIERQALEDARDVLFRSLRASGVLFLLVAATWSCGIASFIYGGSTAWEHGFAFCAVCVGLYVLIFRCIMDPKLHEAMWKNTTPSKSVEASDKDHELPAVLKAFGSDQLRFSVHNPAFSSLCADNAEPSTLWINGAPCPVPNFEGDGFYSRTATWVS